ncbi:MAG TPA: tyrosine/phenylalanine carboxypeptidase domain-containing protein [Polyangiaceae bacterium]
MRADSQVLHPLDAAGESLARAEDGIALVARATPLDVHAEIHRLSKLAANGAHLRPVFRYAAVPDLAAIRSGLERMAREAAAHGAMGRLLAARAEELELEARLAGCIGTPAFAALAARRFRAPRGALATRVAAFVEGALAAPQPSDAGALVASDDGASPASLFSRLTRGARELGFSIRVVVRPEQLATAATGHGIVAIRPGVLLDADTAARIAGHELLAHALPRARSVHAASAVFRAGTAGSVEGEEGRAVLVEERAGYLGPARRRELALRHVAALAVRRGADFHETAGELLSRGANVRAAIEIAVRVHRGGGLARELVYLPAYCEVRAAFAREPELERFFERGRVGLEAALGLHAERADRSARFERSSNQNPV